MHSRMLEKVSSLRWRVRALRLLLAKIVMGLFEPVSMAEAALFNELFIQPGVGGITAKKVESVWKQTIQDMWLGDYEQGLSKRSELAKEVLYGNIKSDANFFPPLLHPEWGQAIGHLGHLGVYLKAQQNSLIAAKSSLLQVSEEDWLSDITLQVVSNLVPIEYRKHNSFASSMSTNWHLYDRIFCIKDSFGYTDILKLHEKVFSSEVISEQNPLFPITDSINNAAFQNLSKNQMLRLKQPYISFHLRHKKSNDDPRMCSPSNYEGVFEEVKRAGFQVVIFGDTLYDFGFTLGSNVIDLRSSQRKSQSVIPYVIHNSKGLITTHSGPAPLAWSFGKPVLATNCIHIDYFVLAASKNSFYLPKIWVDRNGSVIPLRKVFGTRLGQWGWSSSHHLLNGARLKENSAAELSLATRHFLDSIKNGYSRDATMEAINSIRIERGSWGTGLISPSLFTGAGEKLLN